MSEVGQGIISGLNDAVDLQALMLLEKGPHEMNSLIEDEDTMAAAMVFLGLKNRGLLVSTIGEGSVTHRITPKGLEYLYEHV